jgi:hypothetical protein
MDPVTDFFYRFSYMAGKGKAVKTRFKNGGREKWSLRRTGLRAGGRPGKAVHEKRERGI